ncbi:MAG: DUF6775 family putative metallopeptidase [Thermoleophilia bacterium]
MLTDIYIYEEPRCKVLDSPEVARYVAGLVPGCRVQLRAPFLENVIERTEEGTTLEMVAEYLAAVKVRDLSVPVSRDQEVLFGEVAYERRRLKDTESSVCGILYDAAEFSHFCAGLLCPHETGFDQLHIVITNQLIGTWGEADRRYHARTVFCGSPSIISLSGLVAAPAKSPAYYIVRHGAESMGMSEESKLELADSFADDCVGMDDLRLTEVVKGYVMQAIVYRIEGEAFCREPGCRLFNAHWQRELLEAQIGDADEFCRRHEEFFSQLAKYSAE